MDGRREGERKGWVEEGRVGQREREYQETCSCSSTVIPALQSRTCAMPSPGILSPASQKRVQDSSVSPPPNSDLYFPFLFSFSD